MLPAESAPLFGLRVYIWRTSVYISSVLTSCVLPGHLQAALILLFRWLAKIVFTELTNYENWKTEAQYEDAFITKNYSYAFCNAYFPIIFVAFIANSVQPFGADVSCGNTCADYLILLVGIIYLQNVIVRAVTNILFSPSAPDSAEESDDLDAAGAFLLCPGLFS
jgi:hypothetical protein